MMALVHDLAEADVGDITPPAVSGVSQEDKLALEAVSSALCSSKYGQTTNFA